MTGSQLHHWLNWDASKFQKSLVHEPSKPSKLSFDGFEGRLPAHFQNTSDRESPARSPEEENSEGIARASWILNLTGSRIMRGDTGLRIGIWEDLDGPELRECIRTLGMGACRVLYLESETVALRYKVRQCPDRLKGESFQAFIKRAEQIHRERFPHRGEVSA